MSSVQSKVKEIAASFENLHINEIRILLGLERAIARLVSQRELYEHLVFKGGYVLFTIHKSSRFTRDADAIAMGISKNEVIEKITKALSLDLKDGFWFGDIKVKELLQQGEYGAMRFDFAFQIGDVDKEKVNKYSRLHMDIGCSDQLNRKPLAIKTKALWKEEISWKIYPPENIMSEKIHALVDRGSANSRAKDIYDLVLLAPKCRSYKSIVAAIEKTFENRKTKIPDSFLDFFKKIDTDILKKAWPSVRLLEGVENFDLYWEKVMQLFTQLDQVK